MPPRRSGSGADDDGQGVVPRRGLTKGRIGASSGDVLSPLDGATTAAYYLSLDSGSLVSLGERFPGLPKAVSDLRASLSKLIVPTAKSWTALVSALGDKAELRSSSDDAKARIETEEAEERRKREDRERARAEKKAEREAHHQAQREAKRVEREKERQENGGKSASSGKAAASGKASDKAVSADSALRHRISLSPEDEKLLVAIVEDPAVCKAELGRPNWAQVAKRFGASAGHVMARKYERISGKPAPKRPAGGDDDAGDDAEPATPPPAKKAAKGKAGDDASKAGKAAAGATPGSAAGRAKAVAGAPPATTPDTPGGSVSLGAGHTAKHALGTHDGDKELKALVEDSEKRLAVFGKASMRWSRIASYFSVSKKDARTKYTEYTGKPAPENDAGPR